MRIVPGICLLLALAGALLAPTPARAAGPSLSPAVPGVEAGDAITFAGQGFAPDERLSIWATAPNQAVLGAGFVFTDDAGRAEITFRVPEDALGGTWAITAFGLESKTPAIAQFTVAGRPADSASLLAAAAPTSGGPGTIFSFAAAGFDSRERISYWFTGPDGIVHDAYNQTERSDRDGRVDLTWTAPGDAPRGRWVVTIQGIKSGVARAVSFEVR
jgi:hypothetical protein